MITEQDFKDALLTANRNLARQSIDFTGWDAYEAIEELLSKYKQEAYNSGFDTGFRDGQTLYNRPINGVPRVSKDGNCSPN